MSEFEFEEEFDKKKVSGNSFDIQRASRKLFANFHWVILFAALGWLAAKVWLRYQVPVYQISANLLVGDEEASGSTTAVLREAGLIQDREKEVDNEIFILKSFPLVGKVVDSMNLTINVERKGRIKKPPVDIATLPVSFSAQRKDRAKASPVYVLQLNKGGYTLMLEERKFRGGYDAPLPLPDGDTLTVHARNFAEIEPENQYFLQFLPRNTVVSKYQDRLHVKPSKTGKGMLEISLKDEFPERGQTFLNLLIYEYNEASLEYKNQAIRNALEFLNNRIAVISTELAQQENRARDIKVQSNLMDVSSTASAILQQMQSSDAQQKQNSYNEMLLDLVESSVKKYNGQEEIVPNAAGLNDPVLSGLIAEYNKQVLVKRDLLDRGTPNDPNLGIVNGQLSELRTNILKNVQNVRAQFNTNDRFLSGLNSEYRSRFQSLPQKEKEFVQINRQLTIKEQLYVFLLQKKEDVAVQLVSSDVYNSRVVDEPRNKGMIAPNPNMIYATGFGLGLMLPIALILLSVFLNKKIQSRRDVEQSTSVPVVAEIMESQGLDSRITINEARSIIAEQFRLLRTNLNYMGSHGQKKVVLVTSFVRNEGKSFTSLNLAGILSHTGKKVVILEFDLRKPKLLKRLGLQPGKGISDYIVTDIDETEIIQTYTGKGNTFDVIGCGSIPPNPSELILDSKVDMLFAYLRENYDYIIMDTAPVGLVADTFSLARVADVTLYIVRHDQTEKPTLNFLNKVKAESKLPNIAVVINGIKAKHGFGYSYGYGYGYGYGYASEVTK